MGIAPWTLRNALEYDRFLLLDTSGGETMYLGNNDFPPMTTDRKLYRRAVGGRALCAGLGFAWLAAGWLVYGWTLW